MKSQYLSPCLELFFKDRPFHERPAELKRLGFSRFEFWGWGDKDIPALEKAVAETGLAVSAFCTRYGNLVDPAARETYLEGLRESIAVAKRLGAPALITQVGAERPAVAREEQARSLVDGLKVCAPLLEEAGMTLLVEPLNTLVDHKGYFLSSSDEAAAILDRVSSQRVKMLFDIYHQAVMGEDVPAAIQRHARHIGHFHFADAPGRHEWGTGSLDGPAAFRAIARAGIRVPMGLEFIPSHGDHAGILKSTFDTMGGWEG